MPFSVPENPTRNINRVDSFLGVDFTNESGYVSENKSPDAQNMIRDVPGKVRKCMGFQTLSTQTGHINGGHKRKSDTDFILHCGTNLIQGTTTLYSDCKDAVSVSFEYNDNLYILDGKRLLRWNGTNVVPVDTVAYVPTLTIGKPPAGGGTDYEALNLLSPAFKELFTGDGSSTVYQLSFGSLDDITLVEVRNASGEWVTKTLSTDYSIDKINGRVTFVTAPSEPSVTGEDNVRITASKTFSGYKDRINKCDIGILYGVNGNADRLFVSGNSDYGNYDWFSAQNDFTYFADTNYSILGVTGGSIVGYTMVGNYLATHKDESEHSVIVREGTMSSGDDGITVYFPIVNTLQGNGAIAKHSFGYLTTEPVFLTDNGVYAITASDLSGEKYTQLRSFFLNGKLLKENGLKDAFCVVYNDLYWLFVGNVAYILDGLQPITTDKSAPYSTRQYAGFYRTNMGARCAWVYNGTLYFGTDDGKVKAFYTNKLSSTSYNDDGSAIDAYWTTPDFTGSIFYRNKTFRYLAVRISSFAKTSVKMFLNRKGVWSIVKDDDTSGSFFKFSTLCFSKMRFPPNANSSTITSKTRLKRVDKTSYRFENNTLNEPFGLIEYAIEYELKGYYKG